MKKIKENLLALIFFYLFFFVFLTYGNIELKNAYLFVLYLKKVFTFKSYCTTAII